MSGAVEYLFNQMLSTMGRAAAGAGAGAGASTLAKSLRMNDEGDRLYVTYILTDSEGREYFGRTSGFGTPEEIVDRRFAYHHARLYGFGDPQVDKAAYGDDGYVKIRGREQMLIDSRGGVGSPFVGNAINGISPLNPRRDLYLNAAEHEWGMPRR
jgi:hypothetical protein